MIVTILKLLHGDLSGPIWQQMILHQVGPEQVAVGAKYLRAPSYLAHIGHNFVLFYIFVYVCVGDARPDR